MALVVVRIIRTVNLVAKVVVEMLVGLDQIIHLAQFVEATVKLDVVIVIPYAALNLVVIHYAAADALAYVNLDAQQVVPAAVVVIAKVDVQALVLAGVKELVYQLVLRIVQEDVLIVVLALVIMDALAMR